MAEPKIRLFPIVSADVALFTLIQLELGVLLIKRANETTPGGWALPGVVVKPDIDGSVDGTALRALASKTHVVVPHREQVLTSSGPDRDPRGVVGQCSLLRAPAERQGAGGGRGQHRGH